MFSTTRLQHNEDDMATGDANADADEAMVLFKKETV